MANGEPTYITKERSESVVRKALNKKFSPEFLNRVDDIIMFNSLNRDNIQSIIGIELKKFDARVKALGYELQVTDAARQFVADKGFDSQYGARPLNRAIQTHIEDPLSELLLKGEAQKGDTLVIDSDGNRIVANIVSNRIIFINCNFYIFAISGQCFINCIIYNLIYQMMKSSG